MKKLMFVIGALMVALNSPAIADVAKSSKGSALCELNKADKPVTVSKVESSAKKPTSEKAL